MKKIGIYAGSFNPFHIGHLDVLLQAKRVFDEVIVAVGINPLKTQENRATLPNLQDRYDVKVQHFTGMLSDYLNRVSYENDCEVFLIRGLRNGEDLQYEQNQMAFIRSDYPTLKTVFFICNRDVEHVSSSAVRALRQFSETEYKKYVLE